MVESPSAHLEPLPDGWTLFLQGTWTTPHLEDADQALRRLSPPPTEPLTVDVGGLDRLDTGGAQRIIELLSDLNRGRPEVQVVGLSEPHGELIGFVRRRTEFLGQITDAERPNVIERLGQGTFERLHQSVSLLSFLGEASVTAFKAVVAPHKVRWRVIIGVIQTAGVDALPIIGLLSFLLGVVIAYQGGMQLELYGANIFIVELVSVTMIRELGPLITAIIVAGRTGSAFTAEIGTMQVTEEIDAMRTIGLSPMEVLVLPKVLGLTIVMPLLTFFSCAMGVFGGMVMAHGVLDVAMVDFWDRIPSAVSIGTYTVGIGKAPVFAIIVGMVGCFQGTQVSGGAEAVGMQTTKSVVQAIFLVIVADAGLSIIFSIVGV